MVLRYRQYYMRDIGRWVLLLLEREVNINVKSGLFNSSLQTASFEKANHLMVKLLLERGAKVEAPDR